MKFILYRDPRNKIQKIPCAVMQTAGLDRAEKMVLYAGAGCVLLCRDKVTLREAAATIARLYEVVDSLVIQMVDASNEAAGTMEDIPDPLDTLDEDVLDDLLANGADLNGLRILLAREDDGQDEE